LIVNLRTVNKSLSGSTRCSQLQQIFATVLELRSEHTKHFLVCSDSELPASAHDASGPLTQKYFSYIDMVEGAAWAFEQPQEESGLAMATTTGMQPPVGFLLKSLANFKEMPKTDAELRDVSMTPFKSSNYRAYCEKAGPFKQCSRSIDEASILWPASLCPQRFIECLKAQSPAPVPTSRRMPIADEAARMLAPLAGPLPPLASIGPGIQNDSFQSALTMMVGVREMQGAAAKLALIWTTADNDSSELVADGVMPAFVGLDAVVSVQAKFVLLFDQVVAKLSRWDGVDSADGEICDILLPCIKCFVEIHDQCKQLLEEVAQCIFKRAQAHVDANVVALKAKYYVGFRNWWAAEARSIREVKKRVLKNKEHGDISPAAVALRKIGQDIAALNHPPRLTLDCVIAACDSACHDAVLYTCEGA